MAGDYWKILEECIRVAKERESQHGSYVQNFKEFEEMPGGIDAALRTLLLLKVSRFKGKVKDLKIIHDDDLIDLINYSAMYLHNKNSQSK